MVSKNTTTVLLSEFLYSCLYIVWQLCYDVTLLNEAGW